nr:MAG TPA: hypothetical protein [Caudoviricetes sp.]
MGCFTPLDVTTASLLWDCFCHIKRKKFLFCHLVWCYNKRKDHIVLMQSYFNRTGT